MAPGRRNALILGVVAAGAAAVGGVVGALALQSRSGVGELLSSPFTDLSGQYRRLADWRGRALVCNFWATWCAPCREEMPLFEAAQQKYGERQAQIVGIAVDNAKNVREFLKTTKVSYPLLLGGADAIGLMRLIGNEAGALPFTVLLDRHGRRSDQRLGPYSAAELDAAVARLVQ